MTDVMAAPIRAAYALDWRRSPCDTRQIARLDLNTGELAIFDLPAGSRGPVQLYPTPDSRAVWVADQGLLDDRPAGDRVFEIDARTGAALHAAQVADAPHGIVVSRDGSRVFATTLAKGTVETIDARSGEVLGSVHVGNKPNGITCLHGGGAMP